MSFETFQTEKPLLRDTGTAGGAITGKRFVNYSDVVCNAKGQQAKGVAAEDADSGDTYHFISRGVALVTAGEALAKGTKVTTNGLGKAVIAGKGNYINGIVLKAQPLADHDVSIQLSLGGTASTVPTTTTTTTTSSTTTTSTTTSSSTTTSTTTSSSTTTSTTTSSSTTTSTTTTTTTTMTTTSSTTTTTTA